MVQPYRFPKLSGIVPVSFRLNRCKRGNNGLENASAVGDDVHVAKADDTEPPAFDYSCSRRVRLFLIIGKMLPAIEFDYQLGGMTHEISNVGFNRYLPSEASAVQATITQRGPKQPLGLGGIFSKSVRVGAQPRNYFPYRLFRIVHGDLTKAPTPTLPRKRERGQALPDRWASYSTGII
jgi:hypothetical protein